MHLNAAAKKMVNSIAGGQINAVKNGGKLIQAFTEWAEPGSNCKADEFTKCLQDNVKPGMLDHRDFQNAFMGKCAQENDCQLMNGTRAQETEGKKYFGRTHQAIMKMAQEVQQDVMGEMKSQKANAMTIAKAYLNEARERYIAWGCDPKCTTEHTQDFDGLMKMGHCDCPASITVSGDTSIIFN